MKQVTQNRRVLRVPAAVHLAAKIAAASEDKTLSDLAAEVLAEALEQRRRQRPTDPALAAALATQVPTQTR